MSASMGMYKKLLRVLFAIQASTYQKPTAGQSTRRYETLRNRTKRYRPNADGGASFSLLSLFPSPNMGAVRLSLRVARFQFPPAELELLLLWLGGTGVSAMLPLPALPYEVEKPSPTAPCGAGTNA